VLVQRAIPTRRNTADSGACSRASRCPAPTTRRSCRNRSLSSQSRATTPRLMILRSRIGRPAVDGERAVIVLDVIGAALVRREHHATSADVYTVGVGDVAEGTPAWLEQRLHQLKGSGEAAAVDAEPLVTPQRNAPPASDFPRAGAASATSSWRRSARSRHRQIALNLPGLTSKLALVRRVSAGVIEWTPMSEMTRLFRHLKCTDTPPCQAEGD
jgi:hypothetical protein